MTHARLIKDRLLLPLAGVLIVLAAWEATVVAYQLPEIVLNTPWAD